MERIIKRITDEIALLEDLYEYNLTETYDENGVYMVANLDPEKAAKLRFAIMELESILRFAKNLKGSSDRLQDSVERARAAGVPEDKILHNYEEGEAFFMS